VQRDKILWFGQSHEYRFRIPPTDREISSGGKRSLMSVFARPDSPYWWLWLETAPKGQQKEKTAILIGTTVTARHDSKRLAQDLYHTRMHELARKVHRMPTASAAPTFETLAATYAQRDLVHHRGRERELEILKRLRADFGDYPIDEIDHDVVKAWRTRRRTTPTIVDHFGGPKGPRKTFPPPSARTVNREVDLLQQVMASGVPKYYARSPIEGLADLDIVQPTRRTISVEEEQRLLAELAPDDQAIFICGQDTLTRLTDILDLQISDDHGDRLDIRNPKNGQAHSVPVSPRLRRALDLAALERARIPETIWLFPRRRRANTERDRRNGYAQALERACNRAGVPYGRKHRGVTFHWATRRTGATRMIRAGGDKAIATVQRIGNWKHANVLIGIYQETTFDEMRAVVASVSTELLPAPRLKVVK